MGDDKCCCLVFDMSLFDEFMDSSNGDWVEPCCRFVINKNAWTEHKGSRETEPYTEIEASSLSMGGIFLKTGTTYETDTVLEVRLALPTGIFKPQVKLLAKVVWSADKEADGAPSKGMALSTLFIDEGERRKLESFLKKSA